MAILQALPTEVALVAADGSILAANDAWRRFAQAHDPDASADVNYLRLWTSASVASPRDAARIADGVHRVLAGEVSSFEIEFAVHTRGHPTTWLQLVVTPLGPTAPSAGVVVMHIDVTTRHEAAEAVRRSEERFRALFDGSVDAMVIADDEGRYVDANPAACALFGATLEELTERTEAFAGHPHLSESEWRDFLRQGRASGEYTIVTPDGQRRHVEFVARANTQPGRHLSVIRDITARKTAESAQRQVEHKFAAVFHASPVAIVISEAASDRILHANPAMLYLLGVERAADLGSRASELELWDSAEQRRELVGRVLDGRPVTNVEATVRRRDHATRTLLLSIEFVPQSDDEDSILITMAVDISERRLLEEQFRQAQKIEAVGRLAGGVAHDFNNLLTVIMGYNESLDFDEALGESAREAVQQIRLATERATTLTRQLLAFSRRQVLQPQIVDLRDVARELAPMLRRLLGEDVELTTEWGEEPAIVRADPGQIEQVLLNLSVNARDAMPQGGRLAITVGAADIGAAFVASHPYVVEGRYVELTVTDTGMGMTPETLARVFEPFFTTKPQGQGTGLGLAMVYGIVKQSDGYIWVESAPGQGSAFRVLLPVATRREEENLVPPDAIQGTPGGHETVLVVEDEDALRELDRQILMRYGYRVLHARTGPDALVTAQAHPGPIHLLLTDVVMPSMSGRELADHLKASRPDMKVLYTSGYTVEAVVRHGVSETAVAFIQKPMSPPALARKVRDVLDG